MKKLTKKGLILKRIGEVTGFTGVTKGDRGETLNVRTLSKDVAMDYSNMDKLITNLLELGYIEKLGKRGNYCVKITNSGIDYLDRDFSIKLSSPKYLNSRTTSNCKEIDYDYNEYNEYNFEQEMLKEWRGEI